LVVILLIVTLPVGPLVGAYEEVSKFQVALKLPLELEPAVPMTIVLEVVTPLPPRTSPAVTVTVPEPSAPVVAALTTPAATLTAPE
jgi:hypothetical protein